MHLTTVGWLFSLSTKQQLKQSSLLCNNSTTNCQLSNNKKLVVAFCKMSFFFWIENARKSSYKIMAGRQASKQASFLLSSRRPFACCFASVRNRSRLSCSPPLNTLCNYYNNSRVDCGKYLRLCWRRFLCCKIKLQLTTWKRFHFREFSFSGQVDTDTWNSRARTNIWQVKTSLERGKKSTVVPLVKRRDGNRDIYI